MKIIVLPVFLLGLLIMASSWLWTGAPTHLFHIGLFLLLASYLLLLIALYWKKVNVYARGGVIEFREKPWSYRFYFVFLFMFWLIPNIILLSHVLVKD